MPPIFNILLSLGLTSLLSTTVLAGQTLNVIFASEDFTTTSGSGDEIDHNRGGFAITNSDGVELYGNRMPGNDVSCYRDKGGRTFKLMSNCFSAPRTFHCQVGEAVEPYTCEVSTDAGGTVGEATGDDHSCRLSFDLDEDESCDENADWQVI